MPNTVYPRDIDIRSAFVKPETLNVQIRVVNLQKNVTLRLVFHFLESFPCVCMFDDDGDADDDDDDDDDDLQTAGRNTIFANELHVLVLTHNQLNGEFPKCNSNLRLNRLDLGENLYDFPPSEFRRNLEYGT
eukprot:4937748-Amphidinium_carterae.1